MNINLKKISKILLTASALFVMNSNVLADEGSEAKTGPVIIQAFHQPGYNLEMTVHLVKAETEELVKVYKISDKNKWIEKDEVPVGNYKIYSYIDGNSAQSATKTGFVRQTKEVVENPTVNDTYDGTPRFNSMQGDATYYSKYYMMVDYVEPDGTQLYGSMPEDLIDQFRVKGIYMQSYKPMDEEKRLALLSGDAYHDHNLSTTEEELHSEDHDHDHESEYEHEEVEKKEKEETFEVATETEDKKGNKFLVPAIAVGALAVIGTVVAVFYKRNKEEM